MIHCPLDYPSQEGVGDRIIFEAFEKAEETFFDGQGLVGGLILCRADGPYWNSLLPGDEKLRLAALKE